MRTAVRLIACKALMKEGGVIRHDPVDFRYSAAPGARAGLIEIARPLGPLVFGWASKSMTTIRLAIVGLGKIARDQHIPSIAATRASNSPRSRSRNASIDGIGAFRTLTSCWRWA